MTPFEISVTFFLQLVIILGVCRFVGGLAARLGQPPVVGEMIAGVMLGPSLFGALAPGLHAALFPPESRSVLFAVSQVGLALYMFLVGLEFDTKLLRVHLKGAAAVSIAGVATPFVLGAMLAWGAFDSGVLFSPATSRIEAMLFTGAAMCITAFPMLARIISERGLAGTPIGTLALAAGAIDDGLAWCLLAGVLASFAGDPSIAYFTLLGTVVYIAVLYWIGRPALRPLGRWADRAGGIPQPLLGVSLMLVMLAAWYTDKIGLYAVFGAFTLGLIFPRGTLSHGLQSQLGPLTSVLLVPLFFTYSGLHTQLSLVAAGGMLGFTILTLLAATLGKGVACGLAAARCGFGARDAVRIGALMNARGLMELIILNIGLEKGIISPTLFSIMVLMAIVTTLAATPLFNLAGRDAVATPAK